ncbi:MAG: hypothetical protein U9N85_13340 [Bacteroidota bacterium]|nr:hypothetical protein [Bacteroidota bacterium]
MKHNFKLIVLLLIIPIFVSAQKGFGTEKNKSNYQFGFKINTNQYGTAIRCVRIHNQSDGKKKLKYIKTKQWAGQIAGYEYSKANPDLNNLVEDYEIFEIPQEVKAKGDEEIKIYTIERTTAILNNLWRLRYSEYPFGTANSEIGKGWAAHPDSNITFLPNKRQLKMLRAYGIENINDVFVGEEAFRLMRDILDKPWQQTYAKGSQQIDN